MPVYPGNKFCSESTKSDGRRLRDAQKNIFTEALADSMMLSMSMERLSTTYSAESTVLLAENLNELQGLAGKINVNETKLMVTSKKEAAQ